MTESQARIIAIANPKGGSTKTTSAFTLAWNLGMIGKTLLIDSDPQGDSRSWHAALAPELEEDADHPAPFRMHTQTDHKALASELRGFRTEFEYIVIDTQGAASPPVLSAIRAADDVIVPTAPAGTDIQNLPDALDFIYAINERQEALDLDPVTLHVLLVRMDMRTNSARQIREKLRPIIADYVGVAEGDLPENTPHVMAAEVGSRAEIMDSFGRVPATEFYKPVVDELLSK